MSLVPAGNSKAWCILIALVKFHDSKYLLLCCCFALCIDGNVNIFLHNFRFAIEHSYCIYCDPIFIDFSSPIFVNKSISTLLCFDVFSNNLAS